jgi:hypothetical protein
MGQSKRRHLYWAKVRATVKPQTLPRVEHEVDAAGHLKLKSQNRDVEVENKVQHHVAALCQI